MTKSVREFWLFFVLLLVAAFGLNWFWEMLQMSGYVEMGGRPWRENMLLCTVATFGDVAITLSICGVGGLASGRLRWGLEGRWNLYAAASLLGGLCSTAIEWRALAFGRWTYSDQMPIVPLLDIGLWPFLQLTLLVPAAIWIAAWPIHRSHHSCETNLEPVARN